MKQKRGPADLQKKHNKNRKKYVSILTDSTDCKSSVWSCRDVPSSNDTSHFLPQTHKHPCIVPAVPLSPNPVAPPWSQGTEGIGGLKTVFVSVEFSRGKKSLVFLKVAARAAVCILDRVSSVVSGEFPTSSSWACLLRGLCCLST